MGYYWEKGRESVFSNSRLKLILYSLTLAFWLSLDALLVYIFYYRDNALEFWVIILDVIGIFLIQLKYSKYIPTKVLYLEIIILYTALKLLRFSNVGQNNIPGLDTYLELLPTRQLISTGHWIPITSNIDLASTSFYPSLHILANFIYNITNTDLFGSANLLGFYLNMMIFPGYLLIVKYLVKEEKLKLLSLFTYTFTLNLLWYVRQTLALVFFIFVLYLLLKMSENRHNIRIVLLLTVIIATLVFSHHLTRIILTIYLVLGTILSTVFQYYDRRNSQKYITPKSANMYTLFILLLAILSYFAYLREFSIEHVLHMVYLTLMGIEKPIEFSYTSPRIPVHAVIYYYGFGFLIAFSTLKTVIEFIIRKKVDYLSVLFSFFGGILILVSLILQYLHVAFTFYRTFIFIAPFLVLTLSIDLEKKGNRFIHHASLILLLLFIFVNLSGYPFYMYDKSIQPDYKLGEHRDYLLIQEKATVTHFDINDGDVVGNHYIYLSFLYYENKSIKTDYKFFLHPTTKYKWLYLDKDVDLKRIYIRSTSKMYPYPYVTKALYSLYNVRFSKVYNNGMVEVYKVT
ncbi:hypothetical protein E3E22_07525 [Thermococcus sp. MV5]|uniref:hypothetical protein n=1 Tax=Thermococcus sp. MV5 TaxID=1638272 RepID=UPI001438DDBB|nr:hypothetical protein [Thermococcus sp. MV5]NJE26465.1 hypothetical protein [Thermococcus sp. MV5]